VRREGSQPMILTVVSVRTPTRALAPDGAGRVRRAVSAAGNR
jgi:hypothetical protein